MTTAVDTKFNFKARIIKDEEGKEVGKTKKQPPVTVSLPMPTAEELASYLQLPDTPITNEKGEVTGTSVDKRKQLVLDAVREIVKANAKDQFEEIIESFGEDQEKTVTPTMLDFDKLTWEFIANLPPSQRGARAIPDEDWEAMYTDYTTVMVAATGKTVDRIKNQVDLFKKPTRAKNNKDVCELLVQQLDLYMSTSTNIEETAEAAGRLRNKFDKWSKEEVKVSTDAL